MKSKRLHLAVKESKKMSKNKSWKISYFNKKRRQ